MSDFAAEKYYGTSTEVLTTLPDKWEGEVAVNWVMQLANSKKFDEDAEDYIKVASLLDAIYENRT